MEKENTKNEHIKEALIEEEEKRQRKIRINKDIATIKKEQLAELSQDNQHQIQKTMNLL